jgi:hypothetical protein
MILRILTFVSDGAVSIRITLRPLSHMYFLTSKFTPGEEGGRPKVRWLDEIQEDPREMGIEGRRREAQDRDQWRRIAQEAKAHVGL